VTAGARACPPGAIDSGTNVARRRVGCCLRRKPLGSVDTAALPAWSLGVPLDVELYGLRACVATPHRLSGVVGEDGDRSASECLRREGPVASLAGAAWA
jgi:hypothetical protein